MKVIWTNEALQETKLIYNYYKCKVSIKVAKSIRSKILSSVKNLDKQARKGQTEELLTHKNEEFRYLLTGNYKVIYKIIEKEVYVMKVFDCRRNPEIIKKISRTLIARYQGS